MRAARGFGRSCRAWIRGIAERVVPVFVPNACVDLVRRVAEQFADIDHQLRMDQDFDAVVGIARSTPARGAWDSSCQRRDSGPAKDRPIRHAASTGPDRAPGYSRWRETLERRSKLNTRPTAADPHAPRPDRSSTSPLAPGTGSPATGWMSNAMASSRSGADGAGLLPRIAVGAMATIPQHGVDAARPAQRAAARDADRAAAQRRARCVVVAPILLAPHQARSHEYRVESF